MKFFVYFRDHENFFLETSIIEISESAQANPTNLYHSYELDNGALTLWLAGTREQCVSNGHGIIAASLPYSGIAKPPQGLAIPYCLSCTFLVH